MHTKTHIKCKTINFTTCKVQNKLQKHFTADTESTQRLVGGCFDADINICTHFHFEL